MRSHSILALAKRLTQLSCLFFVLLFVGIGEWSVSDNVNVEAVEESVADQAYLPNVIGGNPDDGDPDGGDPDGTFFVSPRGNDNNSGTSPANAWATFARALNDKANGNMLGPGDTLIIMDGVYYEILEPKVGGQPDAPITIRAQNDGKAIIDGQGVRETVRIGDYRGVSHFILEGIVAKNSVGHVWNIHSDHNTLRRVSGYNANNDENKHVFNVQGNHTLLEDCAAGGTGRKMILTMKREFNTIRRCFTYWQQWDGRDSCQIWPWGENINIYNGSNNIVENSIGYGPVPVRSISIIANSRYAVSNNNKIYGSIAISAGMNPDGTVKDWPDTHPQPSECTSMRNFEWGAQRSGFHLYGQGVKKDNLFQDIFAWGNAGLGYANKNADGPPPENCQMDHATIFNNGLDAPKSDGEIGSDVVPDQLAICNVTNSYIEGTAHNGEGARLTNRYIDGVLTNEPLWPWPMEDRIQAELGISVTNLITNIISQAP